MSASLNLILSCPDRIQYRSCEATRHGYRLIAVFLVCSMIVHAGLFIHFGSTGSAPLKTDNAPHAIRVELNQRDDLQKTSALLQGDKTDQQPAPKKIRPPTKPLPEPVTVNTPAAHLAIRAERPDNATPDAHRPAPEATPSREETHAPLTPAATGQQTERSPPRLAVVDSQKQQYLQRIAAHLDRHKFYPRSARRRYIEGRVEVCFDLLENGDIADLALLSGHSSLRKATRDAIYHALPLPARPDSLRTLGTIKIEYAMQYSLQD